jgi:two-component system, response regulator, stage 0 sporulation protein F
MRNRMERRMPAILVIDDDGYVRTTVESVLKRNGFDVVVARDVRAGLDVFRTRKFEAAVIDIFMSEMDGIATIRQLRELDASIPIVVMSGRAFTGPSNGAPDFLGMAVKPGADRTLQKPFRGDELVGAIRCCLGEGATHAAIINHPVPAGQRILREA